MNPSFFMLLTTTSTTLVLIILTHSTIIPTVSATEGPLIDWYGNPVTADKSYYIVPVLADADAPGGSFAVGPIRSESSCPLYPLTRTSPSFFGTPVRFKQLHGTDSVIRYTFDVNIVFDTDTDTDTTDCPTPSWWRMVRDQEFERSLVVADAHIASVTGPFRGTFKFIMPGFWPPFPYNTMLLYCVEADECQFIEQFDGGFLGLGVGNRNFMFGFLNVDDPIDNVIKTVTNVVLQSSC